MKKSLTLLVFLLAYYLGYSQNVPSYVPINGLVGWWPFNGNANDESGNGFNGTINGTVLDNDRFGNINSSYFFDGASHINLTNTGGVNFNTGLTFAAWINPSAIKYASVVDKMPACGSGANGFRLCIRDTGNIAASLGCYGVGPNTESDVNYQTNTWYHVVGTWDISDSVRLYINGSLFDTWYATVPNNNSKDIDIGQGTLSSFYEQFEGIIDDVGIWSRALTSSEVFQLFNSTVVGNSTICDSVLYGVSNINWFGQLISASDGNLVTVGTENYTGNWSNGDIFISKYDTAFNLIWTRKFYVSGGEDIAYGVFETSDGGYLIHRSFGKSNPAGSFSAGYIIKTDSAGNQQWVQTLTGQSFGDNYGSSAVENSVGEFILYGHVQHHPGCSGYATRMTKLSSTGAILWSNCFQLNPDWIGGLAKLASTDNYVTVFNNQNTGFIDIRKWDDAGILIGSISYQYNNQYNSAGSVWKCNSGGFFLTGQYNIPGGNQNAFLAKFDDAMNFQWEVTDFVFTENYFSIVKEDVLGNIYCAGKTNATSQPSDLIASKFNGNGQILDHYLFGSSGLDDLANGITTLPNGDVICSGSSGTQAVMVKFCDPGTSAVNETGNEGQSIAIYPNPAQDYIHINFSRNEISPFEIKIFNIGGQCVFDLRPQNHPIFVVPVSQLTNGIYFLQVTAGKALENYKIVIAR